jgi:hypothetical protein
LNQRRHKERSVCCLGESSAPHSDDKVLIVPKGERMRELMSLQAIGLTPIEAVRYYLALRMAEKGLVSAPNAAAGLPFQIGGPAARVYPLGPDTGLLTSA